MALLVLKLGRTRSGTRAIRSEETEAARELGGKLFESVFGGEVRAALRSSLDEAQRQEGTGLRLKLRLQDAAELADLPWEFLYDPSLDRFLAQSNQTPIVRYIEMPERIKPLTLQLPLRVLVMVSSPDDPNYAKLDVALERSQLQTALDPLNRAGQVHVEWLEGASLSTLQRHLQGGPYHIFHYIGHGGFDQRTEEGVLVLEDEQRRGLLADAHRIGALLHDHRSLRLAVLNSCEGARNSRSDPFAGVATTLIRQGIPAVVAMQFEISDEAAITFAGEFYAALASGFPIDAAVAEARKAIYLRPNDVEWGTPVIFTRAPDGVLFELTGGALPEVRHPRLPAASPPPPPIAEEQVQPRPPQAEGLFRSEISPSSGPDPGGRTASPSLGEVRDLAARAFTLTAERTAQVEAAPDLVRSRLLQWAAAGGFKTTVDTPGRWVFQRGSMVSMLYAFNVAKYPTEVTVEMTGGEPAAVRMFIKVTGRGSFTITAAGDRRYLSEQLDLLLAHLQGAR
jgi:hypothetical protein